MAPIPWSYYATPIELGFKPWAMDFAPDNFGAAAFPTNEPFDPIAGNLRWQTQDWDPALRFWTLPFDPGLGVWLQGQDTSLPSILAACEFAGQHTKWCFDRATLAARGWLSPDDVKWEAVANGYAEIKSEIAELLELMEDDRDRYLAEINAQADGLPAYVIHFIWADADRKPWTLELIRCGLAIGNLVYMYYKALFRRVRPSTLCPGLVPPFGPPRHPSFPSGHSFLGHFIALLLLEISQVEDVFGELPGAGLARVKPTLAQVMSKAYVVNGPLLWLARRLAKNRERAGVHYRSDSSASRWLAGAVWKLMTRVATAAEISANSDLPDATPPGLGPANQVKPGNLIDCPTFRHVLNMARAEWVRT
jgi:hypothetical protein